MTRTVATTAFASALALGVWLPPAHGQAVTPAPAPAAAPASNQPKLTASQSAAASGVQTHALERPLPELHLNGSSLSDVIDFLADTTGANFSVDWKALD